MNLHEERYNELLREFEQVEAINDNLIRKLEKKEEEMKEMRDLCEDLNRDLKEKESTISRAAKVIDTLRAELERAKMNIQGLELINERLSHEKKDVEKDLSDLQRSLQNVDVLMKSETRAKQRTEKFKKQLDAQAADFEAKEAEMLRTIKELQAELQRTDIRLEEMIAENTQLKEQYKEKDVAYCTAVSKIADLEEAIDKLLSDNKELAKEIVEKEQNFMREIDLVKKEAENQLRFYQNTKSSNHSTARVLQDKENVEFSTVGDSPMRLQDRGLQTHRDSRMMTPTPSKTNTQKMTGLSRTLTKKDQSTKKKYSSKETPRKASSPAKRTIGTLETEPDLPTLGDEPEKKAGLTEHALTKDIMKQHLIESVEQTNRLVEGIDNYINKEAKHVNKLVKDVFDHEMGLRAEVERWMMRNEEMEQRLFDFAQKTRIMTIMIADCQAAVKLTQDQRDSEKQLSDMLAKEYETALDYMKIENAEKDRFIKTLLEQTEKVASETINADLQKIETLQNQLNESVAHNKDLGDAHHDLKNRHEALQSKHEDLHANYLQLKDNFLHIEDMLGFNFNLRNDNLGGPEDSMIGEETGVPIGIEAISQKIKHLQKIEEEYHKQNSEFEGEREKLINEISKLQRANRGYEAECKIHEQEKLEIEEQIQSFEESVKYMSRNLDDANERVKHLNQENQVLKEEIHKVSAMAAEYRYETEHFSGKYETLRSEKESLARLADARLENIHQLERIVQNAEEKHREATLGLQEENSYLIQKVSKLEEEKELFSRKELDLELYTSELNEEKLRLASLLEQAMGDFEAAQRKLKAHESRIENLEKENSILTSDNYELKALSRQYPSRSAEKEELNNEFNRTGSESRHTKYISSGLDRDIGRTERVSNGAEPEDLRRTTERINYSTVQRKIKDYETLVAYLEKELSNFCSNESFVISDEKSVDPEFEEAVARNSNFREIQATFKSSLQKIVHVLESQTLAEVQYLRAIFGLLEDKFKLKESKREEIKFLAKQLSELSLKRDRRETAMQLQRGKEIVLDILKKTEVRDHLGGSFEARGKVQTSDIHTERIQIAQELLATLNGLAAEMIERSSQLKSMVDKFSRMKELYVRDSEYQKMLNEVAANLFEKALANSTTASIGLADVLYETSRRIKIVLTTNGDFNRDNPVKSLLRLIQTFWEKDDKFLSSLHELMRDLEKKVSEYTESKDVPLLSARRERKEPTMQKSGLAFREFFEELLDIMKITRHYISGLEEKSLKNPSLTSIIDEPEIILNVLQDNLKANEKEFINNLQKLFEDYLSEKRQDSGAHAKELFFDQFRSLSLEKLKDEALNVRNAYKLLDINLSLKNLVKNDGVEEVLRRKTKENNDRLVQVIGVEQKILNYSALFGINDREQEMEPEALYDAIVTAYKEDPAHTRTAKRDKIQMQIYEMLREIGGFKILFNSLLSLCTRFQRSFIDTTS